MKRFQFIVFTVFILPPLSNFPLSNKALIYARDFLLSFHLNIPDAIRSPCRTDYMTPFILCLLAVDQASKRDRKIPELVVDLIHSICQKQLLPLIVPKGTKITNDAVALEAGRGKGSIKKSREVFADLIQVINEAAAEQAKPKNAQKEQMTKATEAVAHWRCMLEAALGRETSLLYELFEIKRKFGAKVLPLRRA